MSPEEAQALDTVDRQTTLKAILKSGRSEGFTGGFKAFRIVGPLPDVHFSPYHARRVVHNVNSTRIDPSASDQQ